MEVLFFSSSMFPDDGDRMEESGRSPEHRLGPLHDPLAGAAHSHVQETQVKPNPSPPKKNI